MTTDSNTELKAREAAILAELDRRKTPSARQADLILGRTADERPIERDARRARIDDEERIDDDEEPDESGPSAASRRQAAYLGGKS